MRTSFSWRLLDTRLVQTLSAEYSALPTAGKRGQKFFLKMKTPAGLRWVLIPKKRKIFFLYCGGVGGRPGFFSAAGPGRGPYPVDINGVSWDTIRGKGSPGECS